MKYNGHLQAKDPTNISKLSIFFLTYWLNNDKRIDCCEYRQGFTGILVQVAHLQVDLERGSRLRPDSSLQRIIALIDLRRRKLAHFPPAEGTVSKDALPLE